MPSGNTGSVGNPAGSPAFEGLISKYRERLESEFGHKKGEAAAVAAAEFSQEGYVSSGEYREFKKSFLPRHLSVYESLCRFSGKLFRVKPGNRDFLQQCISICHLTITPEEAASFALIFPILFMAAGLFLSVGLPILLGNPALTFFAVLSVVVSITMMFFLSKLPEMLANSWRLKASNQMVQCVFYVVTYMRHTSNLERAIDFAAEHLDPPLSLDMKKVLWDVETETYANVKESLDNYLESWKRWNSEFIEAFQLIEASLYESSEEKRLTTLDRSLNTMLEETYEKMLHYAHELKNPVTMLYMIGIILPVLGLVILPLATSFLTSEELPPLMLALYIAVIYNVALPLFVYLKAKSVLSTRPTGYGDTDISESPELRKHRNIVIGLAGSDIIINPVFLSIAVGMIFLFIGLAPLLLHYYSPSADLALVNGEVVTSSSSEAQISLLGYKRSTATGGEIGPYGIGAAVLSIFVTLAAGISIGLYFRLRSMNVIRIRERTKQLEEEFAGALFQLGNRLGDGLPAEVAFAKVGESMKGTASGDFFRKATQNMESLGLGLKQALFDNKVGAVLMFPSKLIESSMKVLLESSRKGPAIASQTLINVSEYIKQIHRVNERLRDLLADIIADMKQQTSILAPAIAGIVVGITSMILTVIGRLQTQLSSLSQAAATGEQVPAGGILNLFGDGIPTYYFQIIVGIYIVQVVYILTILINGIESGSDKLSERDSLGRSMINSTLLYCAIALFVTVAFNFLAMTIMGALNV